MRVVFATANAHKLREASALLSEAGYEVIGLDAWPEMGEIPEDHDTFIDNALQKARTVYAHTGLPTVADDSGIEIRALDWAPGVHSKRWTAEGTDAANNAKLLRALDNQTDRMARYRCAIALVTDQGERTAAGCCEGTIGTVEHGTGGFGYDPLFWPVDIPGKTMAEITLEEKNGISHRARAFRQLPGLLAELTVEG